MIILYSGIPGSGKTYKMVHDLLQVTDKYYIVHNIDGLQDGIIKEGVHFVKYCEDQNLEITDFFSKDYQVDYTEAVRAKYNKNTLVIIDEAQEWFDKNKKNLKMWLSYHRHLNQEIWMVAHRSTNLPSIYRSFIDVEFRAKTNSVLALPGFFFYNRLVGGEAVGYKLVRKKQNVYDAYKSQSQGFEKKKPSIFLPAIVALCVLGVWGFVTLPKMIIGKGKSKADKSAITSSVEQPSFKEKSGYQLVGFIGKVVMLREKETAKCITLDELSERYILMQRGKNHVKVFDVQKEKLFTIDTTSEVKPPTTEAAKPTT